MMLRVRKGSVGRSHIVFDRVLHLMREGRNNREAGTRPPHAPAKEKKDRFSGRKNMQVHVPSGVLGGESLKGEGGGTKTEQGRTRFGPKGKTEGERVNSFGEKEPAPGTSFHG